MADRETSSISIASIDETPLNLPLRFSSEVLRSEIGEHTPPLIRVSITNEGEEDIGFQTGSRIFDTTTQVDDVPFALLQPGTAPVPEQGLRLDPLKIIFDTPLVTHRLTPAETISQEFEVWSIRERSPSFPSGDYHFEDSYREMKTEKRFSWGFTMRVR